MKVTDGSGDRMLSGRALQDRYNVTSMTLRRWRMSEKVNFPKPDAVINGREYWSEKKTIEPYERRSVKTAVA